MPSNYASGLSAHIQQTMASATGGNVVYGMSVMAVTPGDAAILETDSFATVNSGGGSAVPTTAGYMQVIDQSLANDDSAAGNDWAMLRITRFALDSNDTAVSNSEMTSLWVDYTTV